MSVHKWPRYGLAILLVIGTAAVGALVVTSSAPPQERRIEIKARQYAYDPPIIKVNQGDTIRLRFESEDVVHGFYLEGYDIDAAIIPESPYVEVWRPSSPEDTRQKLEAVVFVANRTGKFRYRCSHTCGTMHPFMSGEFVVAPNRVFAAGVGGCIGLLLAGALTGLWEIRDRSLRSERTPRKEIDHGS